MLNNPQDILFSLQSFFRRNNPIEASIAQIQSAIQFVLDLPSHKKLLKFRSLLYMEQLQSIERNLKNGEVSPKGDKVDRFY
ncbi:MAG: hypothetical protein ACKO34_03975 [Vampirovibrionales bacterium]